MTIKDLMLTTRGRFSTCGRSGEFSCSEAGFRHQAEDQVQT